jgi:hypothetical protein
MIVQPDATQPAKHSSLTGEGYAAFRKASAQPAFAFTKSPRHQYELIVPSFSVPSICVLPASSTRDGLSHRKAAYPRCWLRRNSALLAPLPPPVPVVAIPSCLSTHPGQGRS